MPRNGATKPAAVPNELYDSLDPTARDVWDLIGSLGFRPEKDDNGEWIGLSVSGDDKLGPFVSLSKLGEEAQRFVAKEEEASTNGTGKGKVVKLKADHKGNRYLPGAEEEVDQELKDAAFEEYADKENWKEAGKKKKESKARLENLAGQKRKLFYADPENSSDLIYKVGGITIRMAKEFTVKVKTEKSKSDDDEE